MDQQQVIEIIDLPIFAARMKVAETTVWKWIRNGKLRPGRHFIKIDRVIRFSWGPELINRLLEDCVEVVDEGADEPAREGGKRRHTVRNGQSALDLTY